MLQKEFNSILTGAYGIFAGQVMVRKRHRKPEICKVPRQRPGKGTEGQETERQRWKDANNYYRSVAKIPELKALYKKDLPIGWNAQNRSVSDYYHAPEIKDVDASGYTGSEGSLIRIVATDDFMVYKVIVSIYNEDNLLIESGEAQLAGNPDEWVFTAACDHKGSGRIEIIASDLPGNEDMVILTVTAAEISKFIPREKPVAVREEVVLWTREMGLPERLRRRKHGNGLYEHPPA